MRSPEGCGLRSLSPGCVCVSSAEPSALAAGGCQRARAFLNSSPSLEVVMAQPSIALPLKSMMAAGGQGLPRAKLPSVMAGHCPSSIPVAHPRWPQGLATATQPGRGGRALPKVQVRREGDLPPGRSRDGAAGECPCPEPSPGPAVGAGPR